MNTDNHFSFGLLEGWRFAVTIPAKDEEGRIVDCLSALADSMSRCPVPGGIVVVVNNSLDGTADLACDWMMQNPGVSGQVLVCNAPPELASVGWARRQGLDQAARLLSRDGIMMTSDADASVAPDWLSANLDELRDVDLICGRVEPDRAELVNLPESFLRHGPAEGHYIQLLLHLIERLDPLPHDPAPSHRNAAGASLAFSRALYEDIGGMPCLREREDRVFVANAEARDWRIRYAQTPVVTASCRLTGRTGGGMAAALRARIEKDDPLCDEFIEPAGRAIFRYGLRRDLREAWPDQSALSQTLAKHGLHGIPTGAAHFGTFWRVVESTIPALAPVRLRQSQLASQIRLLEDWLCGHAGMTEVA